MDQVLAFLLNNKIPFRPSITRNKDAGSVPSYGTQNLIEFAKKWTGFQKCEDQYSRL